MEEILEAKASPYYIGICAVMRQVLTGLTCNHLLDLTKLWRISQVSDIRPIWTSCLKVETTCFNIKYTFEDNKIQSPFVNSKSKGRYESLQDIRTSTYQICRTKENTNWTTKFHKRTCNLTSLVGNVCWKYCGKKEKLLLRSSFSSFPQDVVTWC